MRALNELFRLGELSRSDLARQLGLNRSSIGYIVDDLLAAGLARERSGSTPRQSDKQIGRPGVAVEINPLGAIFLGLEIGVDHITLVALDMAAREILNQTTRYSTAQHSPDEAIVCVADILNQAIASLRERASRIKGVCVAIPALVRDGVVFNGFMLGWRDIPLRRKLEDALSIRVPVVIENDANAFAVGETYLGNSLDPNAVVAFLLIENGAGGGIVIGRTLFRGAAGFAGEFGQMLVWSETADGIAVRKDRLERFIGKDGAVEAYIAAGGPVEADFEAFLEALHSGDASAIRAANEWGDSLARGLINLTNILSPELVILGGAGALIYRYVETRVHTLMHGGLLEGLPVPRIELTRTVAGGPALGGACLLHQNMFAVDEKRVHGMDENSEFGEWRQAKRRPPRSPMRVRL